jgi:dipeptide/tripeptide permease
MKEKKMSQEYTYISVGVILGIFISLLFALAFGVPGVFSLAVLCIIALILYILNKTNKDQKANKKPFNPQEKEQFINWKFM